jgi:flagella basal body P-ring formation protein FlgA
MRLPSFFLVVVLAIGLTVSCHAGTAPIQIALSASVSVARADVSLGDIASLKTTDLDTLKRLMTLSIGPAPHAGETTRLGRAELARWIQAQAGVSAWRITWAGPLVTAVNRASTEIPSSRLAEVARESLQAWLAGHAQGIGIALTASPRDVPVPLGRTTLVPRPMPRNTPLSKRMVVWVDVWAGEQFLRTVPVGFEVTAYGAARHEALAEKAPVLAADHLVVAEGPAASANAREDVRGPVGVTRGDRVALSVRSGGIEMESRVEALQSGRVGQVVSVKAPKGSEAILARVVGPGRVEAAQ